MISNGIKSHRIPIITRNGGWPRWWRRRGPSTRYAMESKTAVGDLYEEKKNLSKLYV